MGRRSIDGIYQGNKQVGSQQRTKLVVDAFHRPTMLNSSSVEQTTRSHFNAIKRQSLIPYFSFLASFLVLLSIFTPWFGSWQKQASYDLGRAGELLSPAPKYIQDKLEFNTAQQEWTFNKNALQELPSANPNSFSVGNISYSAQLPANMAASKTGMRLADAERKLEVSLKPKFALESAKNQHGRLVYPITGRNAQLVYSFKYNGAKEDIILYQSPGNTARFTYELQLPRGMEAKIQSDGSVGIFGGAPTLYGNISYGSDNDQALIEKARENSTKDHLYYEIPPPAITGDKNQKASAKFTLKENELTVEARGLDKASYPLSIDPSLVMDTSGCKWQKNGNNEDNISYSGCQLSRSTLSGGSLSSWAYNNGSSTGLPVASVFAPAVANGYIYISDGNVSSTGGTGATGMYFASINGSGVVQSFSSITAPVNYDLRGANFVSANGYLYLIGGTTNQTSVMMTRPNTTNGSVSSWTSVSGFAVNKGLTGGGAAFYNGKIYVAGGCTSVVLSTCNNGDFTHYATVNADGTLSAWSDGPNLPTAIVYTSMTASNGYLYVVGGRAAAGSAIQSTVSYAPINNNGSIGSWSAATSLPVGLAGAAGTIINGYLYVIGGCTASSTCVATTYLAKVYANGALGPFQQGTSLLSGRYAYATNYNGIIYVTGGVDRLPGVNAPVYVQDVEYATISTTPGEVSPLKVDSHTITNGVDKAASVVYGGYLYMLGGNYSTGNFSNTVAYVAINPDGSLGTWGTTSSFTTGRSEAAAVAFNGYMYVMGGNTSSATTDCVTSGGTVVYCRDIQVAPINSNGTLGAWSSAGGYFGGASAPGRGGLGAAVYNGYMYVIGGDYISNANVSAEVDVAPINSNGTVGTWTQNASALGSQGRSDFGLAQMGKYVYIVGGRAASLASNDVLYATLSDNGGMSAWSSAGATFTTARAYEAAGIYNGYLYIAGGWNGNVGASQLTDVQYVKIDPATGALSGSWSTSSTVLTAGSAYTTGKMLNGFFYVIGGCSNTAIFGGCNAFVNSASYAQIYNGGGGSVLSALTNATSVVNGRKTAGAVTYNGYMYVMGGSTGGGGTNNNTVEYAAINKDGSLGTFNLTSSYNDNSSHPPSFTVYNGYLYKLGGYSSGIGNFFNDAQYAAICTGSNTTTAFATNCTTSSTPGTISSWAYTANSLNNGTTQAGGFNIARSYAEATAYNGYIYLVGGCTARNSFDHKCTGWTNTLEGAALNADGTVGTWTQSGSTFTTARGDFAAAVNSGYLYILGGCTGVNGISRDCNAFANDVQYAKLSNGGVAADAGCGTAWCQTSPIDGARYAFETVTANGYIYAIGGSDGNATRNDLLYAPIQANGTIGQWAVVNNAFTTARMGQASTVVNGRVYVISGCTNTVGNCSTSGMVSDIQYMGLMSTSAIARYSMLLTTDKPTNPANYFATSSKESGSSSINFSYATAASTASPVFSSYRTNYDLRLPSPTKYAMSPGSGDGAQYYLILIVLDDTNSVTTGETSGSNMSYLQLNYHPNPSMRLRGGKTFNNSTQQSLDAP